VHEKQKDAASSSPGQGFLVRRSDGSTCVLDERSIKQWVLEERLTRSDEVAWGDRPLRSIGTVEELRPYFTLLDDSKPGALRLRGEPPFGALARLAQEPEEAAFDARWSLAPPLEAQAEGAPSSQPSLPIIVSALATDEPLGRPSVDPIRGTHTPIPPTRSARRRGPATLVSLGLLVAFLPFAFTALADRVSEGNRTKRSGAIRMTGDAIGVARARSMAISKFHRDAPEVARPQSALPALEALASQEALDRSRDTGHGYYYLLSKADRLREAGDCGRARPAYDRALGARRQAPAAIVGLGLCLLEEGDAAGARLRFEEVLRARPTFAPAVQGLELAQAGGGS
jgi:hypothetical protein